MIEAAYLTGEAMGLPVWCTDQAGPFQTVPQAGQSWQPEGEPARQPHEYVRDGTAKALTLFRPADGRVRVKGVTSCPNTVLHAWLKEELTKILASLPAPPASVSMGGTWERWRGGRSGPPSSEMPPLWSVTGWPLTGDGMEMSWPGWENPSSVAKNFHSGETDRGRLAHPV